MFAASDIVLIFNEDALYSHNLSNKKIHRVFYTEDILNVSRYVWANDHALDKVVKKALSEAKEGLNLSSPRVFLFLPHDASEAEKSFLKSILAKVGIRYVKTFDILPILLGYFGGKIEDTKALLITSRSYIRADIEGNKILVNIFKREERLKVSPPRYNVLFISDKDFSEEEAFKAEVIIKDDFLKTQIEGARYYIEELKREKSL